MGFNQSAQTLGFCGEPNLKYPFRISSILYALFVFQVYMGLLP